jgi:membrane fusion protein (multidrug efflux system)
MCSFVPLTRLSGVYLVREGLHADDRILYEGAQNVREGMSIQPRPINLDTLKASQ